MALSILFSATMTGDLDEALPIDCLLSDSFTFSIPKTSNTRPALVSAGIALFCNSDEKRDFELAGGRHVRCREWMEKALPISAILAPLNNAETTHQLFFARSCYYGLSLLCTRERLHFLPFLSNILVQILLSLPCLCPAPLSELEQLTF